MARRRLYKRRIGSRHYCSILQTIEISEYDEDVKAAAREIIDYIDSFFFQKSDSGLKREIEEFNQSKS
jgi:hypothetical protein